MHKILMGSQIRIQRPLSRQYGSRFSLVFSIIALITAAIMLPFAPTEISMKYLVTSQTIAGLLLLIEIGRHLISGINILTPSVIFISGFWLVHFGFFSIWLFDSLVDSRQIFSYEDAICRASMISVVGLASFIIGYLVIEPRFAVGRNPVSKARNLDAKWEMAGWVFLGASWAAVFTALILSGASAFQGEYQGGNIRAVSGSTYTNDALMLFSEFASAVGIALVSATTLSSKRKKKETIILLMHVTAYVLLMAVTGDRSLALVTILLFVSIRGEILTPIRPLHMAVLCCLVVVLTAFIGLGRTSENRAFDDMAKEYQAKAEFNPFVYALLNTGYSFVTVSTAVSLTPADVDFGLGRHKITEVLGLVPFGNRFLGDVLVKPTPDYFSSSYFLTDILTNGKHNTGFGTTITADLYLDFGVYGVALGLFGLGLISGFLKWRVVVRQSILSVSIYAIYLAYLAILSRYSLLPTIKTILWCFLLLKATSFITRDKSSINTSRFLTVRQTNCS